MAWREFQEVATERSGVFFEDLSLRGLWGEQMKDEEMYPKRALAVVCSLLVQLVIDNLADPKNVTGSKAGILIFFKCTPVR